MKRPRRKYIVRIEDATRLREIGALEFSPFRLALCVTGCVIALAGMAAVLFTLTPLRSLLAQEERYTEADLKAIQTLAMRVDSLRYLTELNDSFLTNVNRVLDIDRMPDDSLRAGVLLTYLPVDSLMTGSPAERRFVATMEEKENYNLKVLSPIAAEGMIFSSPVDGGIVAEESQNRFMVRFIAPVGAGVSAVADGNVVDTYYSSGTYKILVQHPNGFMSRYSDVGTPLVENGARVYSGQLISLPKDGHGAASAAAPVGVEMWHDGTPVYPADYVLKSSRPVRNHQE